MSGSVRISSGPPVQYGRTPRIRSSSASTMAWITAERPASTFPRAQCRCGAHEEMLHFRRRRLDRELARFAPYAAVGPAFDRHGFGLKQRLQPRNVDNVAAQ